MSNTTHTHTYIHSHTHALTHTHVGVSCFFGVWLYHHHTKKEFGAVLFEMAATLILDNRSIIVVFFACLFVQTFWLIAFAITCVQAFSNTYYHLIYTLLFVGYVWTVGVLEHIIHAVVAEALCRWYFKVCT